jgi:hypothetical protein
MTAYDGSSADDFFDNINLLPPEEALDDQEVGEDLDAGYSPAERPRAVSSWGTTAAEESAQESLDRRLSREEPGVGDTADDGDGLGDTIDTDGELIDDQVGDRRAGRLVIADVDAVDQRSDYWATEVGIDGAGASAEEAAIHLIPHDEPEC